MNAGFQCWNDSGTFQVDGVYPQFVLKRKLSVECNLIQRGTSLIPYKFADFELATDEIAAIVSDAYCAIIRVHNEEARVITPAHFPSINVDVYVFGKILSSMATFGMQVFNTAGDIVFDAGQKPLAMVGFPVGEGNFTYTAGRSYAAICLNQYLEVVSTGHDFGGTHREKITLGVISRITNGINISNVLMYDDSEVNDPGTASLDSSVPAFGTNRHIIIDVTHY